MTEYTPDLDDVREAWIYWQACASLKSSRESGAEFDRSIAKIKADAWGEGYSINEGMGTNPYKEETK